MLDLPPKLVLTHASKSVDLNRLAWSIALGRLPGQGRLIEHAITEHGRAPNAALRQGDYALCDDHSLRLITHVQALANVGKRRRHGLNIVGIEHAAVFQKWNDVAHCLYSTPRPG